MSRVKESVPPTAPMLIVDAKAMTAKQAAGIVPWAVFEDLALSAHADGGRQVVTTNARDVASRLGIGKNTAAAAISKLRALGWVTHDLTRTARGRFGAGSYVLAPPPGCRLADPASAPRDARPATVTRDTAEPSAGAAAATAALSRGGGTGGHRARGLA